MLHDKHGKIKKDAKAFHDFFRAHRATRGNTDF
jgi:hypothetical protein